MQNNKRQFSCKKSTSSIRTFETLERKKLTKLCSVVRTKEHVLFWLWNKNSQSIVSCFKVKELKNNFKVRIFWVGNVFHLTAWLHFRDHSVDGMKSLCWKSSPRSAQEHWATLWNCSGKRGRKEMRVDDGAISPKDCVQKECIFHIAFLMILS